MSLSSEDRLFLRDLFNGIRDVQRETNALLEEIRDLLKSPPVTIERRTGIPPQDWNKFAADALHQARCTCGESKGLCPVHEPAQERAYAPGDTFSSRSGGRDLPKAPPGTFWFFQHQHDRYMLRPADASDCTCDGRSPGLCPVPGHRRR